MTIRFAISPEAFIALQTPANEASSSVAAKSHALFQYIIRPPRECFSILAGKSLQISHFVEFRADIALSTGLIHRIPGDCVISRWISHVDVVWFARVPSLQNFSVFATVNLYRTPRSGAGRQQLSEGAGVRTGRIERGVCSTPARVNALNPALLNCTSPLFESFLRSGELR